jgi:PRTRC genetic system protein A
MHVINPAPQAKYNPELAALLFGSKGEVKIESTDSEKQYCVGIFSDGSWEKRITDVGIFVTKRDDFKIPYLSKAGSPSFEFTLPKPPIGMLEGIANFFKLVMAKMKNSEVMVQIFWNKEKEKYFIYVPVQSVTGASISFTHSEELQNDPNSVWVIDIHSHNTMGAFFSGGDDADEKSTRVFGVLGQLNKEKYASVWRAGSNGYHMKLDLEDVWDVTETGVWYINEKLLDRVSERRFINHKANGSKFFPGQPYKKMVHGLPSGGYNLRRAGHAPIVPGNPYDYDYGYGDWSGYNPSLETHIANVDSGNFNGEEINDWEAWTEMEAQKNKLEDLFVLLDSGEVTEAEISVCARGLIEYFGLMSDFGVDAARAVIDELAQTIPLNDFNSLMVEYEGE